MARAGFRGPQTPGTSRRVHEAPERPAGVALDAVQTVPDSVRVDMQLGGALVTEPLLSTAALKVSKRTSFLRLAGHLGMTAIVFSICRCPGTHPRRCGSVLCRAC
jgi:hypothetical protein